MIRLGVMLTPNGLTLLRVILVFPLFFILYFGYAWRLFPLLSLIISLIIFIFAELTDSFDGYIARRHNLVSNIGKIFDPFADVIWRLTIFYFFTYIGLMPTIAFMLILWRELSMMFMRHVVEVGENQVLAARWMGKLKACVYALCSFFALLYLLFLELDLFLGRWFMRQTLALEILFWVSAAASVLSFIGYAHGFWIKKTH